MCVEKCVETINGYLSKWIWLGCMGLLGFFFFGGGGSGYTKRMDDGWMCSEKCENRQWLPH